MHMETSGESVRHTPDPVTDQPAGAEAAAEPVVPLHGKAAEQLIRQVTSRAMSTLGWSKTAARRSAIKWLRALNDGAARFNV
jgi:hypothetical protein